MVLYFVKMKPAEAMTLKSLNLEREKIRGAAPSLRRRSLLSLSGSRSTSRRAICLYGSRPAILQTRPFISWKGIFTFLMKPISSQWGALTVFVGYLAIMVQL